MTVNRLGTGILRGGLAAQVSVVVDAITRRDRWSMARLTTGPLLDELPSGRYDEHFGATTELGQSLGIDGAPVVLIDDGLAIVVTSVTERRNASIVPVTALLVQAPTGTVRPWFVPR